MKYNKNNPLRVFIAFAGYDSQSFALQRLKEDYPEFDFVRVGWAEFDPQSKKPIDEQPAVIANRALFPDGSRNYGDITSIMWQDVPDFDLFTYSFPCQSISNAGRQAGLEKGSGTRSSLLWECERAIEIKRPKYLLMENVKALLSKKFKPYWTAWTEFWRVTATRHSPRYLMRKTLVWLRTENVFSACLSCAPRTSWSRYIISRSRSR